MITFHNILQEIGINNPHKLKAEKIVSDGRVGRIMIDNYWFFWDGDSSTMNHNPGYWCWWFYKIGRSNENLKRFTKWKYFSLFQKLKDEDDGSVLYGIPKSKIQIINNLNEIGINIPNKTVKDIIKINIEIFHLINRIEDAFESVSFINKKTNIYIKYGWDGINLRWRIWLPQLSKSTLNKMYYELYQLKNQIEDAYPPNN